MLTPLLHAPIELQIHVAAAILAMGLAPVQFLRRRRDRAHKVVGYAWVSAMAVTAVSSFWLRGFHVIGEFSPIHALSVLVLVGLVRAILAVRRGDVALHRSVLHATALWGLGVAGLFTLVPGRLMNEVLYAEMPVLGFAGTLAAAVILAGIYRFRISRAGPGRQFR